MLLRLWFVLWTGAGLATARGAVFSPEIEFFEKNIRPVLVERCYACHSTESEKLKAGLRLDSRAAMLEGGDTGPALVPGEPARSLIVRAISYQDPDLRMPPKSRLDPAQVSAIERWIQDGAVWPEELAGKKVGLVEVFDLEKRRAEHWAWKPTRRLVPPPVVATHWPAGDIDRFLLARLESEGLHPASEAGQRTLLRRASFALTGLPPTPAEVDAFLRDDSPGAFERVVDRLLASPHFGERWARHWLDKVRYAETMGHEFDYPILGAWQFRDYVVRVFNNDVPYDQFAREQIAGDLLSEPRRGPDGANESVLGTVQYWLGQQVHSPVDVRQHQIEFIDNQIDVLTKSFLGLTVSCARCHDHKFDAISARDYYAMYGVFSSSRYAIRAVDRPDQRRAAAVRLLEARDTWRRALADQLRSSDKPALPPAARSPASEFALRLEDRILPTTNWIAEGEAFAADPRPSAQPIMPMGTNDAPALRMVPPGWWHSGSLSLKFQGALRSPTFTLDRPFMHLLLAGRGTRVNVVVEGFTLIRAPIYGALRRAVQNPEPHWHSIDVSMWNGRRVWIELADWTAPDPASELGADAAKPDGWIALGALVFSSLAEPPGLRQPEPIAEVVSAVRRWDEEPAALGSAEAAAVAELLTALPFKPSANMVQQWSALERTMTEPILVGAMTDGTGLDEPVFIRGNYRTPGPLVPRGFLTALRRDGENAACHAGSGRLELAQAMTAPENPLFARVMVNWVWHHLFGRGLVASVDNFGALGERPSHPELLDWLANEFRSHGWSTKKLIRQILLSRAWRMRGQAAHLESESRDPENALLHRAHLRRLEGETIRDAMLALSGRLDPRLGGPSVSIHLTPFMDGRGRPGTSGPLDGEGRRSLYLETRRNFLSPTFLAFDTPVPSSTVGRRTVSNVPAQALILMNDRFVVGEAQRWGKRLLMHGPADLDARVRHLYLQAFAAPPSQSELAAAKSFLSPRLAAMNADADAVWGDFCHVLFNTKAFIYLE